MNGRVVFLESEEPAYLIAAFDNGYIRLERIPGSLHTYEMCKKEVERGGSIVSLARYIKNNPIDDPQKIQEIIELCIKAAAKNDLKDIPEQFRNEEVCLICVSKEIKHLTSLLMKHPDHLLRHEIDLVPDKIKNSESFWVKLISDNPDGFFCIKCLPKSLMGNINVIDSILESYLPNAQSNLIELYNPNYNLERELIFKITERIIQKEIKHHGTKPILLVLYYPEDGVRCTGVLIEHLENRFTATIILMSPEHIINQTLLDDLLNVVDGVILPGGPDVPNNPNDKRLRFEKFLLETAIKNTTPVLGICRGHQMIGEYFGASITYVDDHNGFLGIFKVKNKDTEIRKFLDKKYQKWQQLGSPKNLELEKTKENNLHYKSYCDHNQTIFFNAPRDKKQIKISVRGLDDTIEALEINQHIFTYQHHHEIYASNYNSTSKLAKALLKLFTDKVQAYFDNKNTVCNSNGLKLS